MDEARIQGIEFEIVGNADSAARSVNEFGSALKKIREITKGGLGLKSLSEKLKSISQKVKIKIDTEETNTAAKKISILAKSILAIKRIAFYRAIRSAIKVVTDAVQKGAENAYWYSRNVGGDVGYVAEALDRLSSAGFKMQNQLGAAWGTLKAAVTPVLIEIINFATRAAQAVTQLFAALSGRATYIKAVDYTKEAYENTQKGAKAAKEWKNQLLGFDEINRLEEPSSSNGNSGNELLDYENMFEEAPIDSFFSSVVQKIKALKDSLNFEPIKNAIKNLEDSVSRLGLTIANGLGWAWDNILVPLAHWTIESAAPAAINLLASAFNFLSSVLEKLSPVFEFLWEKILKPIANWTGDRFITWIEAISNHFNKISALLDGKTTISDFIKSLNGKDAIIMAFATALGFLATKALLLTVASSAIAVFKAAVALLTNPITIAIVAITLLAEAFLFVWQKSEEFRAAIKETFNGIKETFQGVKDIFTGLFTLDPDLVAKGILEFTVGGYQIVDGLLSGIEEAWKTLIKNFKEFWQKLVTDFKDFFGIHSPSTLFKEFGDNIIQGFWDGLKSKWNELTNWFSEMWNTLSNWWGNLTLPLINVPKPEINVTWEPVFGENGWFKLPHFDVTWYARGGIVDGATLIGAGEAGKEAIIPLERNTEWIGMVANELNDIQRRETDDSDFTADMEEANGVVVNAIMAASSQIIRAMGERETSNFDFDSFVRSVSRVQRQQARATG